jgi:hypothetical protein
MIVSKTLESKDMKTYGTYTPKQLADQNCRCTRCEEARRAEQLEAVKRAVERFANLEDKNKEFKFLRS